MDDELQQPGHNGDGPRTNTIAETSKPARRESFPELFEFVAAIERQHGFSDDRIEEIRLALEEVFKVIMEYSYPGRDGRISVVCKHDHWGKLMIVISDSGEPSNLLLADVAFFGEEDPVDKRKKASAKLIKKLIDNVEYKRVDGENILTFAVMSTPRKAR
jgi:anti-sigma regulatory factor (Ser/Thr protein kinase)